METAQQAEIFSRGSAGLAQDLVRKDRRTRQLCVGVEQLDELYFSKGGGDLQKIKFKEASDSQA